MNYSDAYDVIARLANDQLPKFADGWSRWPMGFNAVDLVQHLQAKTEMYYDLKLDDHAKALADISAEIIIRADNTR